ncbi:hypothetical protein [Glycomyces xiaoerkulensis]|uniref:hypothetical protein n=1 Tax=Glycomyces xiaoerkulensis TaxID=2038139 RepID=UPI0012FFED7D|nr:hypothetical protein [Glycomyces xiaoerkulensis]
MNTIRKLLLAAVLAAAASLLLPAPAQANETVTFCFQTDTDSSGGDVWDCHQIPLTDRLSDPELPPGCPACGLAIDFEDDHLDPKVRAEYLDRLATGFATLGESETADDPDLADGLRLEATEAFIDAAATLGDQKVTPERTGWVDQATGEFIADDYPPIESAAGFLSGGLRATQAAGPDPSTNDVSTAVWLFESGYHCFVVAFER